MMPNSKKYPIIQMAYLLHNKKIRLLYIHCFPVHIPFHLEPASRKAEILYQLECDVGANKNAGEAFSMKRLSSHSN